MGLLVKNIVTMAQKQLEDAGIENAKGECEALYCHLMKVDRSRFFMEGVNPEIEPAAPAAESVVEGSAAPSVSVDSNEVLDTGAEI